MAKVIFIDTRAEVQPKSTRRKQQDEQLTRRIEDEVNRLFEAVGIPTPADEQHGWLRL
jgi:hypothetical protein